MQVTLGTRTVRGITEPGEEIVVYADGGGSVGANEYRLISVSVGVLPSPDKDWMELWKQQDFPADLEEPDIRYGDLAFTVAEQDLEREWTAITQRVATVNRLYEERIIPAREAAAVEQQQRKDAKREAIEQAQRRLDALE